MGKPRAGTSSAVSAGAPAAGGADGSGACLIVAVGTHATLEEFLDKGRSGMASTFLTRLRVGGKLVDAKGSRARYVRLYSRGNSANQLNHYVEAEVFGRPVK